MPAYRGRPDGTLLEAKAAVPFIANLGLGTLAVASYHVAEAFDWVNLTAKQETALTGFAAAAIVTLGGVLAYLMPHTSRPDLGGP